MPREITWLEIVMGCGLLIGGAMLLGALLQATQQNQLRRWAIILSILLFLVPFIWGEFRGNTQHDIVRDALPFWFLIGIPILLIYPANNANRNALIKLITAIVLFVGISTATTFFYGAFSRFDNLTQVLEFAHRGWGGIAKEVQAAQACTGYRSSRRSCSQTLKATPEERAKQLEEWEHLATLLLKLYEPAMLFTSIFLTSWGVILVTRSWRKMPMGILLLGCGLFVSYGFMIVGLRAYTGLFATAFFCASLTQIKKTGFYIRVLPFAALGLVFIWPHIVSVVQLLWLKQQMMGTNGKAGEWIAVFSTISASPQTLLFGIGWGGTFENPILLNDTTRFTHSLLSFYLLKTGIMGLIALVLIFTALVLTVLKMFGPVRPLSLERLIVLFASIPVMIIGVLFEPTYKMLSYGIILSLLILTLPTTSQQST